MKIGLLTSRFNAEKWSGDQIIVWAGQNSIQCLEVCVRSRHIDVEKVLSHKEERAEIQRKLKTAGVEISSLANYTLDINAANLSIRQREIAFLRQTIEAAEALGVTTVCVLAGGAAPGKTKMDTIRQDLPEIFGPLAEEAAKRGVKLAFENWFRTNLQHLDHWQAFFQVLPQANLGLNFDPSHLDRMEIDYLAAIDEFAGRIFHTHAKDVEIDEAKRRRLGTLDSAHARYTIPGTGRIPWGIYLGRLRKAGYNGVLSIEHEDATLGSEAGFRMAAAYLRTLIA